MTQPGLAATRGQSGRDVGPGAVLTSPKGERYHEQDVQHLFRAIRKGKAHLTRFMLAASNNVLLNCWDAEGKTPLIECCYIKEEGTRDRMVRILKEAGADVNMPDREGRTPLIHACWQRCNDIIRILIQHCNISPDVSDKDGNTALIHAATAGNDIALEIVVRHFRRLGLQVDHYNAAGYTALHIAAKNGFLNCAKILAVKGKASLTLKDKVNGLTPLDWCLNEGYQKTEVEFLKPSAKFYRLAKLTTTMAKYRKKSSVTSQESLPHVSAASSSVDRAKGKVKNLLKKSSAQTAENPEFMAIGAGCIPKQKTPGSGSKLSSSKSSGLDTSNFKPSTGKKSLSKSSRQRSLTLSNSKDNGAASKPKSALQHSISQPCPGRGGGMLNEKKISAAQKEKNGIEKARSMGQHQVIKSGMDVQNELTAELDSEDESSGSGTETISLRQSLNKSTLEGLDNQNENDKCDNERSTPSDADRSSYGILSLSQYTDGGVYCGDVRPGDVESFSDSVDFPNSDQTESYLQSLSHDTYRITEHDCSTSTDSSKSLRSLMTCETDLKGSVKCQTNHVKTIGFDSHALRGLRTTNISHVVTDGERVLLVSENNPKNKTDESESEDNSLSSMSTKCEILDKTGVFRDESLQSLSSSSAAHAVSVTGMSMSKRAQTDHKDVTITSGAEIDDGTSVATEVTEISDSYPTFTQQNTKKDYSSENVHSTHDFSLPSDKACHSVANKKKEYLDLSSSAVYSRRLQTKLRLNEPQMTQNLLGKGPSAVIDDETNEDDPSTDETYIAESYSKALGPKVGKRHTSNCFTEYTSSSVHQEKSRPFGKDQKNTIARQNNYSDASEEEDDDETNKTLSTDIDMIDNSVNESDASDTKVSCLLTEANLTSLRISEGKDFKSFKNQDLNSFESNIEPIISMKSQNNNHAIYTSYNSKGGSHDEENKNVHEQSPLNIIKHATADMHNDSVT